MLTVVSGMDLTGKSTICSKLSNLLSWPIHHFDKPKDLEDGKKQYFDFQKNIKPETNIICDRYHDGEHVYAPLYRNYESNYLEEFETELRKVPYLFVNTTASLNTIIERVKSRGEDYVKEEHYQTVLDSFSQYLIKQTMPYIIINTDDSDIESYIKNILVSIDKIQRLYNYANNTEVYFGNLNADTIIVLKNVSDIKKAKEKYANEYNKYWFTTCNNKEFLDFQSKLLKPNFIYEEGDITNENI